MTDSEHPGSRDRSERRGRPDSRRQGPDRYGRSPSSGSGRGQSRDGRDRPWQDRNRDDSRGRREDREDRGSERRGDPRGGRGTERDGDRRGGSRDDQREVRRWDDRRRQGGAPDRRDNDRRPARSGDRRDDYRRDQRSRPGQREDRGPRRGGSWQDRDRRDERGNDRREDGPRGDRRYERRDDRTGRGTGRDRPRDRRDDRRDDRRPERRDDRRGDRRPDRRDGRREAPGGDRRFERYDDHRGGREDRVPRRDLNDPETARFVAPDIDDDVTGREIDKPTRRQLEALEARNADRVAQHLVMTARYLEADPGFALEHANAAVRKAGRVAVVREAAGIAAYAAGDYALALKELRTHRRISGSEDNLALIVDCQRALGRAAKALEEAQSPAAEKLDAAGKAELAMVVSGIHTDAGDHRAALEALQIPQLDRNRGFSYSPRLFRAYAQALRTVGREREAAAWQRQATVAEAALGIGAFSEPEIVDLGDDIDLDDAARTVRAAGDRHSEPEPDTAEDVPQQGHHEEPEQEATVTEAETAGQHPEPADEQSEETGTHE